MIKVEQQEVSPTTGDCMRASIASILEVDLQTVPHITRIDRSKADWFSVLYYYMIAHKYIYSGMWCPSEGKRKLLKRHSINRYYLAVVNSATYPAKDNITHMVVMDENFKVAHDPHPDKKWQGKTLLGNKGFKNVYKFRLMNKTDLNYWHYL